MMRDELWSHPNWGLARLLEGETVIAHRDGTLQRWAGFAVVLESGEVLGTASPEFERLWTKPPTVP